MTLPEGISPEAWKRAGEAMGSSDFTRETVRARIARAIDAATERERERCANLAEDVVINAPSWMQTPQGREDQARITIAAAIRGDQHA